VPHIAYVLGHRAGRQGVQMLLAYTSSGRWRGAGPAVPVGVIKFDAAAAQRMNQRAFHLDLRCLARMLLTPPWFPRLRKAEQGVVAVADRGCGSGCCGRRRRRRRGGRG
jgi:hypothetical protein